MARFAEMRGAMAKFEAFAAHGQPNQWSAMLRVVVDILLMLCVVTSPVRTFVYEMK